jgi:hypothetical protein
MFEDVPWIAPAVQSLEDAHLQWHDAAGAYHEPAEFRRHLEALIQSVRNVTFRLQSQKDDAPGDFDIWYGEWQQEMRSSRVMTWLNESRVQITKRGGLSKGSRAIVKQIASYSEPNTVLLKLAADTPTSTVVRRAIDQIPEADRPFQAVEVARRWETIDLPDWEILSAVAESIRFVDAVLQYAALLTQGRSPESPALFQQSVRLPPCMVITPDLIPIAFEADTGRPYALEKTLHQVDVDPGEAAKRYGIKRSLQSDFDSLDGFASATHDISRAVFKKDREVLPLVFFRAPSSEWVQFGVVAEDKRDKFMIWRRFAGEVLLNGFDAFVYTCEVWSAPAPGVPSRYIDVSQLPGRQEFVSTYAAEASTDEVVHFMSRIHRPVGIPVLGRRQVERGPEKVAGFASPIRRVWELWSEVQQADQ